MAGANIWPHVIFLLAEIPALRDIIAWAAGREPSSTSLMSIRAALYHATKLLASRSGRFATF